MLYTLTRLFRKRDLASERADDSLSRTSLSIWQSSAGTESQPEECGPAKAASNCIPNIYTHTQTHTPQLEEKTTRYSFSNVMGFCPFPSSCLFY